MQICLFILNSFDYDSRARLLCHDILSSGFSLNIFATEGGPQEEYEGAPIYRIAQPVKPFRQRRFIEFNIRAAALASKLNADIYHAVDLDTLWAAVTASRPGKAKVVYESRELYTELLALNNRPLAKWFWRNLEKRYIHRADAIITINRSIADQLIKRYDIEDPVIIPNVASIPEPVEPVDLQVKFSLNSRYILIYQGILRPGQGILRSLKALACLNDVGLVIAGAGPYRSEMEEWVNKLNITDRVKFAGKISPELLPAYTSGADAGFLLMEPVALNNYLALPQKLFQYITAGVPPIVSNLPELRAVVENGNLGLVLPDGSSEQDSQAIRTFLENNLITAKANCHKAKSKYSWENEGEKIIGIYKGLV